MAKDLFSQQASMYAKYRPGYPAALFDYILSFVQHRDAAWDCATGNGQAAVELAKYFENVTATDISEKQLQQAIAQDNIEYLVAPAEATPFPDNSFDLITVAQAYHWFNFEAFHREATRVSRPGGIVAVWGYSLVVSDNDALNAMLRTYYRETVGPYWDKERRYVDDHYTTVAFAYDELPSRDFKIEVSWTRDEFIGYLNTWSSAQHFIKANNYNPVEVFAKEMEKVWPEGEALSFYFPLFLRIGRVGK